MANLIAGETLRVLLVSEREEVRDEVGEALAGRAGDHRLHWVSQPDLAATRAEDLLPHVLLVDDALGDTDPVKLIGQLAGRLPSSAILALVPAGDMERRPAGGAGGRARLRHQARAAGRLPDGAAAGAGATQAGAGPDR